MYARKQFLLFSVDFESDCLKEHVNWYFVIISYLLKQYKNKPNVMAPNMTLPKYKGCSKFT